MAESKFKDAIVEELSDKKLLTAYVESDCEFCSRQIDEGDDFYFIGDRKKMCIDCHAEMITEVEEKLR